MNFYIMFFIKDEVTVNENLATFFAKMMTRDFFKGQKVTSIEEVGEEERNKKQRLKSKKSSTC